jgi:probable rRNA maturation factor
MPTKPSAIQFHYQAGNFTFKNRNSMKRFIEEYIKRMGRTVEAINVIFCTDKQILRINNDYLQHDFFTDIITFELSAKGDPLLSDIFISVDRVKENATQFSSTFTNELHRVIFHGILHLLGYSDKTSRQIEEMRKKESDLLHLYFNEGNKR